MPATVTPSGAETLYSLSGGLDPTRLSVAYRLGLTVVAVTMLVLPLIYLGLIALSAGALWWHLTRHAWILTSGGNAFWNLLFYLTPALAGAVLIFFMIKPVLARPAKQVAPLPLAREDQPGLFGFIEDICRQVRAPIPSRIQVDCQVNASAGFSSIFLAFVRPEFVLTIGLPLVAGLTVRQFGGVLAHEFGHFTQGGGMRLTFVVRAINMWFARVVHDRDHWDERLERWSREADWRVSIGLWLARGSVWCTRQILTGLMIAGQAISCFMLRQMEYDADSYEIELVGSRAFVDTSARLRELNVGAHLGYGDLREDWQHRTLPSNLPAFLLERSERIPRELVAQIREVPEGATGYFDTHPSDADRVHAAECADSAGIMAGGDAPASLLFVNFDALSAAASRHHYEHDLGLSLAAATFVATDVAMESSLSRERRRQSAGRFFGNRLAVHRAFAINAQHAAALETNLLVEGLRTSREAMRRASGILTERYEQVDQLSHARGMARAAQALIEAGFETVPAQDFGLSTGTLDAAKQAEKRIAEDLQVVVLDLANFETLAAARLACAIALLKSPTLGLAPETCHALEAEASRLVLGINALARTWTNVNELSAQTMIEGLLRGNLERSPNQARAAARLEQAVMQIRRVLERMRADVGDAPAPDTSGAGGTLVASLQLHQSASPHGHALFVVETARSAYFSAIGRLAEIALMVEDALG
jgi:Zn-dependent protease with chaperone function